MNPADTIVAIASAPVSAPRGVIRVSGRAAVEAVRNALGPTIGDVPWTGEGARCERDAALHLPDWPPIGAMLLHFPGPRSYTGETVVEIHTVGSLPWLDAIVSALTSAEGRGAAIRVAERGEFSLRAFRNGKLDLAQAEAVAALVAQEEGSAGAQVSVLTRSAGDGALDVPARVREWRDRLQTVLSRAELAIDFSEDEDFWTVADPTWMAGELRAIEQALASLVGRAEGDRGRASRRPEVVLLGPPNAGKSSLFNELVGSAAAIVSRHAGTTRDAVEADIDVAGAAGEPALPIRLWDTAGLHEAIGGRAGIGAAAAGDPRAAALDAAAESAAGGFIRRADLVLWCWPSDLRPTVVPAHIAALPRDRWLLVETKSDQAVGEPGPGDDAVAVRVHPTADTTMLIDAIRRRLGRGGEQATDAASGVNVRQAACLRSALEHVRAAMPLSAQAETMELAAWELGEADGQLAAILGEDRVTGVASEALLARIFGAFCLGK